jgi:hypothetical protein
MLSSSRRGRQAAVIGLSLLVGVALQEASLAAQGFSLRFYGNGVNDIDRVKIQIDEPERPADVGATNFTIEWWMKANPGENASAPIVPGGFNWINGNIILDRDTYGAGDFGDFGVSVGGGRLAFGVGTASGENTIVGTRNVTDGQWHHVAVTRQRSDGRIQIYVDGTLDATGDGPNGDASYRNGRSGAVNDPFIVLGAEKLDFGSNYPSYRGWLDEMRISNSLRYTTGFTRLTLPFVSDGDTVALYHFDEGTGITLRDTSGAAGGPSNGLLRVGGSPQGPEWSNHTPFASGPIAPRPPTNLRIVR